MSLTELAEKSNVQIATLSRMENQKMTGTLESHMQIAKALGIDLTELYQDAKIEIQKHDVEIRENELLKEEIMRTEKLKSIGILAEGIAREIRKPLIALKTFAEHLPGKLDDKEFLKKFSRIVGHEVDCIDSLMRELMEFAKPSPLNLKDIHIHSLIDNTTDFLNSYFLKHNIEIVRNYDVSNTLVVNADLNRLRQAFLNIFLNAIEAMESGGQVKISLKQKSEEKINIIIEDSGLGISTKNIKHIFDPFYTTKNQGTGLGLSITQRIIQDHNGKILVKSTPGKGTKFIIELPMKNSI